MEYYDMHDPILCNLVTAISQNPGAGITITLHVSGIVVTGILISTKEYADLLGDLAVDHMRDAEAAESWRQFMNALGDNNYQAALANSEDAPFNPEYLCMKEAYYCAGDKWQPNEGVLWRGKITDINGFHLGAWRPSN